MITWLMWAARHGFVAHIAYEMPTPETEIKIGLFLATLEALAVGGMLGYNVAT